LSDQPKEKKSRGRKRKRQVASDDEATTTTAAADAGELLYMHHSQYTQPSMGFCFTHFAKMAKILAAF